MAGLELLYSGVASSITCPQDVVVCFVHWEIVKSGYKCLGSGDEPRNGDKKSELLPTGWNGSKELYTLRYKSNDDKSHFLVKAITVDSTLIFNLMDSTTEQVSDLTVNVSDYVDAEQLQTFESVFKNTEDLAQKVKSQLLPSAPAPRKKDKKSKRETTDDSQSDSDPLHIPTRHPQTSRQPNWPDPMAPFAAGGADLDPFGPDPDHMPPPGYDDMFM
ncbi:proteasome inhibitor PI31 subunit isoform X2 [Coregonus clupeaformis]|uniref:proteasome inhibitor PI31 subunit isoform X2 n=1 Tax=Coregonus clupeaformis TaxID=59861 RepID=UPI001E1C50AD|nr:proteasome inhibitor PI31 subunit isoform X2 [Coregonus clupeaformis]